MKTTDLTGPILDYWVARAEGVPPSELITSEKLTRADGGRIIGVPGTHVCVRLIAGGVPSRLVLDYSTNWALGGPLIEKYRLDVMTVDKTGWCASAAAWRAQRSESILNAICRAVVFATFGDEVEDKKWLESWT